MAMLMPHHRFTLAEYEQMIEAGIFTEDTRVELIRGEVVSMSPIGSRHAECVTTLIELLIQHKPSTVRVTPQNPIQMPDHSEPQPDVTIIRSRRYWHALPTASDVLIVIEVSDTSRDYDRNTKLPLYAAAGIPEAWIVDITADRIERHTEPAAGGYQLVRYFGRGTVVESVAIPTLAISVDEIVGGDE